MTNHTEACRRCDGNGYMQRTGPDRMEEGGVPLLCPACDGTGGQPKQEGRAGSCDFSYKGQPCEQAPGHRGRHRCRDGKTTVRWWSDPSAVTANTHAALTEEER